jgi:hypothetical protein
MKYRFLQYVVLAAAVVVAAGSFMTASVQAQNYAAGTSSVSTPRTPDGKPDLSGMWIDKHPPVRNIEEGKKDENGNVVQRIKSRRCDPTQKGPDGLTCYENTNQNADGEFLYRVDANRPLYKPEYWDKVQGLDYNTNTKDPIFTCMPLGVPRMGAPAQIIQAAKYVVFFYNGAQTQSNQCRIIPVDGRGHDPVRARDISYFGDPVGRWDGDTLVVESVGFNDETWLNPLGGGGGYFHSYDMRLTERFRREGNTLHYQATVDDPTVLLQPWVLSPKELQLHPDPQAYLQEGDQCSQPDPGFVVSKIRH